MSLKALRRQDQIGNRTIGKTLGDGPLAAGDREEAVRWLERMLRTAGYDPGRRDQRFDASTEAAVKQFQKARDLPQTGQLDEQTFNALKLVQQRVYMARSKR